MKTLPKFEKNSTTINKHAYTNVVECRLADPCVGIVIATLRRLFAEQYTTIYSPVTSTSVSVFNPRLETHLFNMTFKQLIS